MIVGIPKRYAFAIFADDSRRCGVRVRRVRVHAIYPPLECAAVEYRPGFITEGAVIPFARLSTKACGVGAKIREAFPNLSRLGPGSPAAAAVVA